MLRQLKAPKCLVCGNLFTPQRFMQRTCSPACSIQFAKTVEKEAKARNIQKRPAIKTEHPEFVKNREALKQQLIDYYGYAICQVCFHVGTETHHIIYRSEKPGHKHIHDIRNLLRLCKEHHGWFHAVKGRRDKLVEERNLTELFGNSILSKKAI